MTVTRGGSENCDREAGFLEHLIHCLQDALTCKQAIEQNAKLREKSGLKGLVREGLILTVKLTHTAVLLNGPESFATCYPR